LNANAAVAADFNHDGHLYLAVSNYNTGVYVLWGQTGGTFVAPKQVF